VSRFPVDDDELSGLHARAFGGENNVTPWGERLRRHALTWVGEPRPDQNRAVLTMARTSAGWKVIQAAAIRACKVGGYVRR